jgi:endonuclease YncB( thermonuclease family)
MVFGETSAFHPLRTRRPDAKLGIGGLRMIVDCPSAYVVDGDTLRCGAERLRLLGIDAPEIERCPRWRACAPGDGQAAKRSLVAALRLGPVRYQPVTIDRYGRQVAVVWAGNVNLSCWQLQRGQAIYKPKWDNGRLIARACR